ncbi:MAG: DUF4835 family protein [Rhodothermales bacterium]|nr:DUF4835 family protein [Rhodothermales bacterium]
MYRLLVIFIGLSFLAGDVTAQELDCTVDIDYRSLSGSDYTFLDDLRDRVDEYINRQFWTEDRFQEFERIDCSFNIVVVEALSLTSYRANIIVASRRPIYGSMQNTKLLQINDEEWLFDYTQGATLTSNRDVYDPITTLLDYYVFLILGYDYDTFSELGGTPFFERARIAADLAKNAGGTGWNKLGGERGRTSIVEEVLDPRFRELRQAYYLYHRRGLDLFVSKIEDSRLNVLEAIQSLKAVYDVNARSYVMDLFFAAKYQEIVEILRDSPVGGEAYDLLTEMDLSHVADYGILIE